jgi:hypothetical protein
MDRVNKSPNGIQSSVEEQRENWDILRCLSGNLLFCYSSVFFYTGPLKDSHLHPAFFHELQMCFRCSEAHFSAGMFRDSHLHPAFF